MNGAIQIRIGDLLHAVVKRWKWVLLLSLAGLGFGFALNGITYIRGKNMNYEITCSAAVTSQSATGAFTGNSAYLNPNDFYLSQDLVDAAQYVIQSDRVLSSAIERAGLLNVEPKTVLKHLELSRYHETQIIEMELRWNHGDDGLRLMNGILEAAKETLPETLMVGAVSVIDEPAVTYLTSSSEYAGLWVILIAAGFFAGIGIAVLDLIMRPTLLNLNDIEDILGLETIGTIPKDDWFFRKERKILVHDAAKHSPAEQNFASAAYILQNRLGSKEKNHCFYVTSSENGEGKTAVAANLAIQLSDMGKKVLLLDLDTKNPSLGGLFLDAIDYSHSLNALYKGEALPQEAVIPLTGYLDFLPTVLERNAIPKDQVLFDFIQTLSENYEYIIIDAPPVGQASDTLSLNRIAHAVLFVVGYDMATLYEIQKAIEKLDKSGTRILGCIVNGTQSFWDGGFSAEKEKNDRKQEPATNDFWNTEPVNPENAGWAENPEIQNILDELSGTEADFDTHEPELSDEEAVSALLRMGTDGSWKQNELEVTEDYEKNEESE